MDQNKPYYDECPNIKALNFLGGKWRLPIILILFDGNLRYNQLKKRLTGITNIMLTRSLHDLEEHGLINRIQHSEMPPHVEYAITDHAKKLAPAIRLINEWVKEHVELMSRR